MNGRARWLLAIPLLVACNNGIDSGVQGDKPVSTVTTDEAMQLCQAVGDYITGMASPDYQIQQGCTIQALGMTTTPEDCRAMRSACIASPPSDFSYISAPDCSMAGPITDCDATVDDVEACFTADIDAYLNRLGQFDCSLAGDLPALQELQMPPPVPSACMTAGAMACPVLEDGLFSRG